MRNLRLQWMLIWFVASVLPLQLLAQARGSRRLALVVGNNAYPSAPLKNAVSDAIAMTASLQVNGFAVQHHTDVNLPTLERSIDGFLNGLHTGDTVLVYYSGHGMQIDGENYIIPTSFAPHDEVDAKYSAYSVDRLLSRIEAHNPDLTILILDACRDNPFQIRRSAVQGWAPIEGARGTYIAFATAPGSTASDNPSGKNGLFTTHLLEALQKPGWGLDQIFGYVRKEVFLNSNGAQLPWTSSSVLGEFYFDQNVKAPSVVARQLGDTSSPYMAGLKSLNEKRYDEALTFFEIANKIEPRTGFAERSASLTRSPSLEDRILDEYTKVLRGGNQPGRLLALRGSAYLRLGQLDKAIADLSGSLEIYSGNVEAQRLRAQVLVLTNRSALAVEELTKLISGGSGEWQDFCFRSFALSQQGRFDEALADTNHAIGVAPLKVAAPYCARANVEYTLGRLDTASSDADACIQRNPSSPLGYQIKGNIFRALDRPTEAADMYRRTVELKMGYQQVP
jgi:tetratricopeptide (TPR) repeat protein